MWMPVLLALASCVIATHGEAQTYPTRPVRLLIPFAPGGSVDTIGRLVGQRLHEGLGQPVVIDNRAGAGGAIAAELTAKAVPDGYTLMLANNSTHGVNHAVTPELRYDPVRDFTLVSLVATAPHLLLVNATVPAKSVSELIEHAKARPGQLRFGSGGTASQTHLAGELFRYVAGIDIVHVPYKGTGPSYTALLSGEIQMLMSGVLGAMAHVQAGRLRALGISGSARSRLLPPVPTLAEQGIRNFEVGPWYAIAAPPRLPAAILTRLHAEVTAMARNDEFRSRLSGQGAEPVGSSPAELTNTVREEVSKWSRLAREIGLKPG
jgi:tripartite-type tricarboxylate transporter receptor subunit TctC